MQRRYERYGGSMNQIMKVFENQQFGKVRVIMQEGEPWFVASDVCNALELTNSRMTVGRLDEDEKGVSSIYTLGGAQNIVVINEPGLYTLVLSSRKPEAKQFKRWITHEVIPSIRKHGAYMTDTLLEQVVEKPEIIFELARRLLAEQEEHKAVRKKLDAAQPKADYYDAFVNDEDCTCIRYSGKEFNIPQNTFVQILLDHKYLYRDAKRRLMPFSDKQEKGYFIVRDCYAKNGKLIQQTLLTCKGKSHIRSQLKKWGDLV